MHVYTHVDEIPEHYLPEIMALLDELRQDTLRYHYAATGIEWEYVPYKPEFLNFPMYVVADEHVKGLAEAYSFSYSVTIGNLIVHKDHRGQGIGTKIIEAISEDARKLGLYTRLDVNEGNDRAKRLYDRLGFKPLYSTLCRS